VRPSSPAPALLWESSGPGPGGTVGTVLASLVHLTNRHQQMLALAGHRRWWVALPVRTTYRQTVFPHQSSTAVLHWARARHCTGPVLLLPLRCLPPTYGIWRRRWPARRPHTALLGCLGAERDGKGSLPGIGGCGICLHQQTPANPAQQHTLRGWTVSLRSSTKAVMGGWARRRDNGLVY
jgi:hypothetical protein